MSYLEWNKAIAADYFNAGKAGRSVTFYIDRRRIDLIGKRAGLGGWEEFWEAVGDLMPPGGSRDSNRHPLVQLQQCKDLFILAIALLVLAWTEGEENRSYYQRLKGLFVKWLPGVPDVDIRTVEQIARRLIGQLPELAKREGEDQGRPLLCRLNHHFYVGMIRFHTLLDAEQRESLAALWGRLGLEPGAAYSHAQILNWVVGSHDFQKSYPSLSKALHQDQKNIDVVGDLLHQEYQSWDGRGAVKQGNRHVSPYKLLLRLDDTTPSAVYVRGGIDGQTWVDALGRRFAVVVRPYKLPPTLVDSETEESIQPDEAWIFNEQVLQSGMQQLKRMARDYFWAIPATRLGYYGGGYVEAKAPEEGIEFMLIVRGPALEATQLWLRTLPPGHTSAKWIRQRDGWGIVQGTFQSPGPFGHVKRPAMPTKTACLCIDREDTVANGMCRAEWPPRIWLAHTDATIVCAELTAGQGGSGNLETSGQEVQSLLLVNRFGITAGNYHLHVWLNDGTSLNLALIFAKAAPLPFYSADLWMRLRTGEIARLEQESYMNGWAYHGLFFPIPGTPLLHKLHVDPIRSVLEAPERLHLGHLLAARTRPSGSMSRKEFCACLDRVAGWELAPSRAKEIERQMESLGMLERIPGTGRFSLAPMRLVRLPDDCYRIRAILIGIIPWAVEELIYTWSRTANAGIHFEWIQQEEQLIPPILLLSTYDAACFAALHAHILLQFPGSLPPLSSYSASEQLLTWQTPLQRIDPMAVPITQHSLSYLIEAKHWDVFQQKFLATDSFPVFPAVTIAEQPYHAGNTYTWWENEHLGVDVSPLVALPQLLLRHRRPWIALHAACKSELVVVGAYRLPPLLDRALVLATGRLPYTTRAKIVKEWAGKLHPDAIVRVYTGIRPVLRRLLMRCLQPFLFPGVESPQQFPEITFTATPWRT